MRERFKARKEESLRLRFHTQTAGSTLTAQQANNNVVRVTLQALAAVLGGTQSLHTNSLDEALGLPSDASARLALRTQQVILEESGVSDTIDPLGGAYAVEALTDALEHEASGMIERIDEMGGMVKAIEQGYPQREIERAAYEYQQALERGDAKVVGLNAYVDDDGEPQSVFQVDAEVERSQRAELRQRREARDSATTTAALDALRQAAAGSDNLFPLILDAVKKDVTVGEICGVLAEHFGRYRDSRFAG